VFWITVFIVILVDQTTKYIIRTHFALHNFTIIPGWLAFNYTLNPGMAMGIDWLPTPAVSLVSIIAVTGILIYTTRIASKASRGMMICLGMIIGGALGNIVDRVIMGWINGTGGILNGHVVDFIHFTLTIDGHPVFPYIFNMADSSITIAVLIILIFNKSLMAWTKDSETPEGSPETAQSRHVGTD